MSSESSREHRRLAADSATRSVRCAVLSISDTRSEENDSSGDLILQILREGGHDVLVRDLLPDDAGRVGAWIDDRIADQRIDAILTTGGTGIARRDATIDALSARIDITLEGFGELFRMLSFEEVGAAAMLSRATAGVALRADAPNDPGVILIAMPGSTNAVRTAMERLIAPELSHLVWERRR